VTAPATQQQQQQHVIVSTGQGSGC
jgi:hypothetical protein